jgi:enoyl-CoA hydratase
MSSGRDAIHIEVRGDITVVTLDRPDVKNAVDRPTAQALAAAFLQFEEDDSQKVAIFQGAHGTFCSGADLKAMLGGGGSGGNGITNPQVGNDFDPLNTDGPMGPSRMMLSKPVIGVISGYAVAGGMELALWCDMRIVEEGAVMGIFCRRWGVPLVDGGTVRLPRLIGHSRALDLIMTGRPIEAEEALMMGLANRVAAKGEGLAAALEVAEQIAAFPQTCMRNDRQSAYDQWDLSFEEAMVREFELGQDSLAAPELKGGLKDFASGKGRGGSFG